MNFRSFIAVFLIIGFLISLYGRAEAESISRSHSNNAGISDPKDGESKPSNAENHPVGAHKDQHGCYHSHSPLNLPVEAFLLRPAHFSRYVTETNLPFFSTFASSISPPPRA